MGFGQRTTGIPGRPFRHAVRCLVTLVGLGFFMMAACAQPTSVAAYGYVREMLPGIPTADAGRAPGGSPVARLPPDYYIYIEVPKGRSVAGNWIWLRGHYHRCSLKPTNSPVQIDADAAVPTGVKETLVPPTANDVYQVLVGSAMTETPPTGQAPTLAAGNDVVVSLTIDKTTQDVRIKELKSLKPKAGM